MEGPGAVTACSACGLDVRPEFAFCPRCGTRLPSRCASCGFPSPPDFRFCPKCGTPLAAAPPGPTKAEPVTAAIPRLEEPPPHETAEADRRLVTVLFADLSGFTALSTGLDPEVVRALQTDLYRELTEAVAEYAGFVEKYVGDASVVSSRGRSS